LIDKMKSHYSIHDFTKWNESKDKTRAKRQRDWRHRNAERNALRNGVISNACNTTQGIEGIEGEKKEEEKEEIPPSPLWNDHQQQCIDQARKHWGASNGDVVVGNLLRVYHEDVVMESMDAYVLKYGADLKPALLGGFCRTRFNDRETQNGKP